MISESYYAVKILFDKLSKDKKIVTKPYRYEKILFEILYALGLIFISLSVFLIIMDYRKYGGYYFNITKVLDYKVNFTYIIMVFLGI